MAKKPNLLDQLKNNMSSDTEAEIDVNPEVNRDGMVDITQGLSTLEEVGGRSALDIPQSVIQRFAEQGVVLNWIRVKIDGRDDVENVKEMSKRGWVLVPASEVPELSGINIPKFVKDVDRDREEEYILVKDVALVKNLKVNVEKLTALDDAEADNLQRSLKGKVKGLDVSKETGVKVATGENALFGGGS